MKILNWRAAVKGILPFALCLFIALGVAAAYPLFSERVARTDLSEYSAPYPEMLYGIDKMWEEDGAFHFKGWAIEVGKTYGYRNFSFNGWTQVGESVYNNNQIALVDGSSVYLVPSRTVVKSLTGTVENPAVEYKRCGVVGEVPRGKIPPAQNGVYTVAIVLKHPNGERFLLSTSKTLEVEPE